MEKSLFFVPFYQLKIFINASKKLWKKAYLNTFCASVGFKNFGYNFAMDVKGQLYRC